MRLRSAATVLAVGFLASCSDQQIASPTNPDPSAPAPSPAAAATTLQRLSCEARVGEKTVTCGVPSTGTNADIIIGGQGTFVQVTSSNVAYNAGTGAFSFDVTVQNLILQTLGTTDGTTPDANGVRIFFDQTPTVTAGTGSAAVANPDGTATFTGTNQPYFAYSGGALGADGLLSQNETSSSKTWVLTIPPTVASFQFFVYVSANVRYPNGYVVPSSASAFLNQGSAQTVSGSAVTAVGTAQPEYSVTYASSAPAVATVNATTGEVTAVAPGSATITMTSTNATTGSVSLQVCPVLAVGEVYTTSGSDAETVCLGGGGATQEYTIMPLNTHTASQSLTLTGSGIQAVTGPPSPDLIPTAALKLGALTSDAAAEPTGSRAAEVARLIHSVARDDAGHGPYVAEAPAEEVGAEKTVGVTSASGGQQRLMWYVPAGEDENGAQPAPERHAGTMPLITRSMTDVGDLVSYNTAKECTDPPSVRTGMVRSIKQRVIIVADTQNPPGGFTTAQYDSIALEFDSIAFKVDSAAFGPPTDTDGNGRVILFYTRAVNELSPPASSSFTVGLFAPKDASSTVACSNSNQGEILYMLVPDPTGVVNSNVRTVSAVRGSTVATTGHEMAHMINAFGRKARGAPNEAGWLDEALAHTAEELMFYRTSVGLAPKGNIFVTDLTTGPSASRRVAAFNTYANPNFGRFRSWLQRPDTAGIAGNSGSLARRGLGWAFIRYASDRVNAGDPAFLQSLVLSADTGVVNLSAAIGGANVFDWLRDFIVGMYTDDAVTVASQYTNPSWNFRSLYAALNTSYQLVPRALTNGVGLTLSYSGRGGTVYARAGVAASSFATFTLRSAGAPPPATVRLTIVRTK